MANIQRNFIAGRMNKSLDERLVPNGEYIDALNVRLGSTEGGEVGSVENSKGNTKMTSLQYEQTASTTGAVLLSSQARCIGAYEDGQSNRIYWFVHDPAYTLGETGKIDMVVSFNPTTQSLTYHIISIDDGFGANTTLNFNPQHLITGIDLVDDLLFFTDNINPPRFINVTQNYPNPFYDVDVVTAEEFMVIKKPPIKAPSIVLKSQTNNIDDFLEERFICFAYRYQYTNGEFSATSQWSEPAFDPAPYNYNFSSNLNEGMINTITGVDVQFNSGSSLVKAIEVLFKESTDDTIKIIDKLSKNLQGYADNTEYTFTFDNRKIFTILPSTELLRLYDNVPLKALGQTLMGNRLVYGNYIEGYDLKDIFNNPVKLEFQANLIRGGLSNTNLETTTLSGNYTFGSTVSVNSSVVNIDFSELNPFTQLVTGAAININFTFEHSSFAGSPTPTSQTENINISFNYLLPENFNSLYELVDSQHFKNAIGTSTNIQPVYAAAGNTSCNGSTLTDLFNCFVPTTLTTAAGTVTKFQSGISSSGEPIKILNNTPSSTSLQLQIPAIRFVQDPAAPPGSGDVYEYFKIISKFTSYNSVGNPTSLHSNRGYEIGVVYMDEFLRSSTALVSPNNTVQIPCGFSTTQNKIQVTIPWAQRAPYWAKHYKFVIKPNQSTYETIYSERFFQDPNSNDFYVLLEGENAAKVETGQRLIVKSDTGGAVNRCVETTVISKEVQSENFLKILNPLDPGTSPDFNYIEVPAGAYMQLLPQGFSLNNSDGEIGGSAPNSTGTATYPKKLDDEGFPVASSLVNVINPDGTAYTDYTIPASSTIRISVTQVREEGATGINFGNFAVSLFGQEYCGSRTSSFDRTYEASATYSDFKTWFDGDNIGNYISTESVVDNDRFEGGTNNVYKSALLTGAANPPENIERTDQNPYIEVAENQNTYQFYRNTTDNSLWFLATGTKSCNGSRNILKGAGSTATITLEINRADQGGVCVFETLPSDASPDIWYENNLNFNVSTNGEHEGTQANQNVQTKTSAIVDTGFFDCFTFGNGVESYTIRDSVKGEAFALGNRVTTTSGQEYKEAHRFADLTYSGVYNDESNVNKLNEFNLGLVNYKTLEDSFGSIQKLHSRKTDILTLQEDKISYVLAGKDLLTDAGGTGSLTSVPEVLGQQISRIEEFGISRNPESFAVFGADKFFTDEQRGAVIQLKGGAYNQESLTVISESGMRGWFRDLFHDNFDAQKIGGFDPYMNEYVLSANSITLPFVGNCDLCGSSRNITIPVGKEVSYCVDVTQEVGTVEIEYVIPSGGNDNIITEANTPTNAGGLVKMITETNSAAASGNEIVIEDSTDNNTYTITALYNGTSTSVTTSINGILNVAKNSVYAEDMTIVVSSNSITADTIEVTVNCPEPDEITIIQVGVVSNADRGKFIHNEYRWQDGLFNSPPHSNLMEFPNGTNNPLVAPFVTLTGGQGAGVIPDDGAKVIIGSNKIGFDNYDFKPDTNNFRFLRTSTIYGEFIQSDIVALLAAASKVTPIQNNSPEFTATFTMPSGNTGDNLYLIYDYRDSTEVQLCYSNIDLNDVCCVGCNVEPTPTPGPDVTPAPLACNSYTLASPTDCTTYNILGPLTNFGYYRYTDCQGNVIPDTKILANEEVFLGAITGTLILTGDVSIISETPGFGSSNTFTWESCSGVQLQETVGGGKSVVKCAQNIPVRTSGTNGTVTAGAACVQYNYAAIQCGSSGTRVFLSGKTSLGLFSVGNFVYYDEINLSGSNVSVRKCAQIEIVNWGNGAGGDIIGEASACNDPVNCPSDSTDNPVWMFNQLQYSGADDPSQLTPCSSIYCQVPVFTSITTTNNMFANNTLFFIDPNFNTPFNGNSKYYGFRSPVTGTKVADQGFMEGWVQIGNDGRVISFSLC